MGEVVTIKGTRHGLLILFDPEKDFEDIRQNLYKKMEAARGFFKGAKFAFYQEPVKNEHKEKLEQICQQYGLIHQPEIRAKIIPNTTTPTVGSSTGSHLVNDATASQPSQNGTLLVKRSLRSGQRINYPGHVVILGDVHAGAEVVAYGNVMVMGSCRGVVHAGAAGDENARVVAHRLTPAQLRISSSIACSPADGENDADYPEIAYLSPDGQIIVEAYNSSRPAGRSSN
ncbi:septum site-determining protein minC [Desulfotomaculum nigrificans CO-1-SRB]|uniref:Probable septum site-determining protein MinC n=1 Tax=Desulfotomaculum nigrificans (strain DSM 14880 / VKM B-2319 / CO-1-SRB) TaxID=868595 RepID=F6B5W8_DESCC|nr:septum site-determining protein MinC [Desulfotomaculum nigrificans]AEF94287.1 septum site-determining protein minC [Desulfotomaculum nigrificans CO-1-SRB]